MSSKYSIIKRNLLCEFQFSPDDIDCICFECWQRVKEFDEFCKHIESVHQQALITDIKLEYGEYISYDVMADADDDIKLKAKAREGAVPVVPVPSNRGERSRRILPIESVEVPMDVKLENSDMNTTSPGQRKKGRSKKIAVMEAIKVTDYSVIDKHIPESTTPKPQKKQRPKITSPDNVENNISDDGCSPADISEIEQLNDNFSESLMKSNSHITTRKKEDPQELIVCDLCGYSTINQMCYDTHVEMKHQDNIYECDICGKM